MDRIIRLFIVAMPTFLGFGLAVAIYLKVWPSNNISNILRILLEGASIVLGSMGFILGLWLLALYINLPLRDMVWITIVITVIFTSIALIAMIRSFVLFYILSKEDDNRDEA